MKNIVFVILSVLLPLAAIAQSEKGDHEISGGIGRFSDFDVISGISYNRDAANMSRTFHYIYGASYIYYLKDKVAVGITLIQHSYAESYLDEWTRVKHSYSYNALFFGADVKAIWGSLNHRSFQMYQSGSIGVMYDFSFGDVAPALYYSPLGIRVGDQNALFLDLGFGYKGLVHLGYSYRINKNKK